MLGCRVDPAGGNGYLAGEHPDGIATIGGAPTSAVMRSLYCQESGAVGDGVVVAEVQSTPGGLNPALRYDVAWRKNGFNDVLAASVSPVAG